MEDMGSMMNYGSTYGGGFLSGLLVLLVKFLIIVLVVSIIIGVLLWLKNNFFLNVDISKQMNQNPMVKTIVGIIAAIIGLVLLIWVFNYLTGNNTGYKC
jgi:cytochrome b subunit of formate dehydrogenase